MKSEFIASVIQMVSGMDVTANLRVAQRWVQYAAKEGAQWVVLPEYFCLMGQHDTDKLAIKEPFGAGPIQAALSALARETGVWLAAGTVPLVSSDPNRVLNTTLLYDPSGEVQGRYDKIHLFRFAGQGECYQEADTIMPGTQPVKVVTPLADVALGICYDLRFPELCRSLLPFDLLVLPAAFTTTTGEAHWEPLLRARAIENQCYVLASSQGGHHQNGRHTHGHSMIIDPWGRILAHIDQNEGCLLAKIDPNVIQSTRAKLPALSHRVLI